MNTVIIFIDVFGVFRHKHTHTRSERISVPTVKGIIFIKNNNNKKPKKKEKTHERIQTSSFQTHTE